MTQAEGQAMLWITGEINYCCEAQGLSWRHSDAGAWRCHGDEGISCSPLEAAKIAIWWVLPRHRWSPKNSPPTFSWTHGQPRWFVWTWRSQQRVSLFTHYLTSSHCRQLVCPKIIYQIIVSFALIIPGKTNSVIHNSARKTVTSCYC